MRKIFVIGIGAGNPDYITVQAINALNEVDVFFVMDKGHKKEDLKRLRKEICERYIENKSYKTARLSIRDATEMHCRTRPLSRRGTTRERSYTSD